jgi:flagellar hook-basal body complex protein FliE
MSPLSAINPSLSAYGLQPRAGLDAAGLSPSRLPGIQMPAEVGQPLEITPAQPAGDSFASMLGRMVSDVNAKQNIAAEAVGGLQSGQGVPLHQAVIAMEEASVSFQLMVEVRNKLLESYQELMRMQI